jgi:hypothetical protein
MTMNMVQRLCGAPVARILSRKGSVKSLVLAVTLLGVTTAGICGAWQDHTQRSCQILWSDEIASETNG